MRYLAGFGRMRLGWDGMGWEGDGGTAVDVAIDFAACRLRHVCLSHCYCPKQGPILGFVGVVDRSIVQRQ